MSLNRQMTRATKTVVVSTGITAGTTVVNPTSVDTNGFSAYRILALLGTLSSGQVTTLSVNEAPDNSTWTAVTSGGTAIATAAAVTATDAGKLLILEVYKPQQRYIQPQINRATGNAVITSVIVELYIPDFQPQYDPTIDGTNVSQYATYDNPV